MGLIDKQVGKKPAAVPAKAAPAAPVKNAAQPLGDPVAARIEIAAKKALAQPEIAKRMIAVIQASPDDPASGIANALLTLMRSVLAQSKGQVPPQAVIAAAQKMLGPVAKLGEAAKLYKITKELLLAAAQKAIAMVTAKKTPQTAPAAAPAAPAPAAPAPAAAPAAAAQPMMGA